MMRKLLILIVIFYTSTAHAQFMRRGIKGGCVGGSCGPQMNNIPRAPYYPQVNSYNSVPYNSVPYNSVPRAPYYPQMNPYNTVPHIPKVNPAPKVSETTLKQSTLRQATLKETKIIIEIAPTATIEPYDSDFYDPIIPPPPPVR